MPHEPVCKCVNACLAQCSRLLQGPTHAHSTERIHGMNQIDQTLVQLKAEERALNWKLTKWLRLIFALRVLAAATMLFSVFVWGGLPLNLAAMGLFLSTWLLPKGSEGGPDVERWRLVTRQAMEVAQLKESVKTGQVSPGEAEGQLRDILNVSEVHA